MGASGFSISFEPLQGGEPTPLSDVQPLIWEVLSDFAWRYTSSHPTVWDGYLSDVGPWDDWFTYDENSITFWFPDFAGCCSRSAGVGMHWLRASLAANFHPVNTLAQDHGWLITEEPPSLDNQVWRRRGHAWMPLRDDLVEISFDPDWEEGGVFGDNNFTAFSELSDEEMQEVREAVSGGKCLCSMCVMLRPDPSFETTMLESLDDDSPDVVQTAVWYLRQTARTSLETALEIVRRGAGYHRDHAATCFDFGQKLRPERASELLDELQGVDDEMERCGLLGLAAGMKLEDEQSVERRLFTFVSALGFDGPVREVAAEYAGYGQIASGHEDHFARALVGQLGASDEFDHNVALTLFNFYMQADTVPSFAVDAVGRLAAHSSDQVQTIASFAHQQLSTRPTR